MRAVRSLVACGLAVSILLGADRLLAAETSGPPQSLGKAVDVGASLEALVQADWIDQDRRFAANGTVADAVKAPPVTTTEDAAGGVDGVKNGAYGFHTASAEQDPWWEVDLGKPCKLDRVVVFNRTDSGKAARTRNLRVLVAPDASRRYQQIYQHSGEAFGGVPDKKPLVVDLRGAGVPARIVRLQVPGKCSFALDEVEVYAADAPQKNVALGKPANQKSVGRYSVRKTPSPPAPFPLAAAGSDRATSGAKDGGFSLAHTRDVVRRGRQLAERLAAKADPGRLARLSTELRQCETRRKELEDQKDVARETRREVYLAARRTVRDIAFCNPLLNIDVLLFLKRHDAAGVFHMCDQFYGCNAGPGGGLYVLRKPFGPNPKLVNVLENSVVEQGRMKGRKLEGGSVLSPEL